MKDYFNYRYGEDIEFSLNEKDSVTIVGNNNDLILHTLIYGNKKCNIFIGDKELNKDNIYEIRKRVSYVL